MVRLRPFRIRLGTLGKLRGVKIWGTIPQVKEALIRSAKTMKSIHERQGEEQVITLSISLFLILFNLENLSSFSLGVLLGFFKPKQSAVPGNFNFQKRQISYRISHL